MITLSKPTDAARELEAHAASVLRKAGDLQVTLTTAESCTGGLVASLLTDIEGCSGAFECGFATYSNRSKTDLLGVEPGLIVRYGAVSEQVARAMAHGALESSHASLAVAITGFARPAAGKGEEGLV